MAGHRLIDELTEFDASEYITTAKDCKLYMAEALETGDVEFILDSFRVIAKSTGMAELSKETGINKESLECMFSVGRNPDFISTVNIITKLGWKLSIKDV